MATTVRTNGLQHAISLGNIEVSSKSKSIATPTRSYDSEDETMTRRKTKPQSVGLFPRGSIYSKGDIREQYCVTDRQLQNSIERPRREGFFGCLSGRGAPQSFLGVCVGRRAPSDENVADYAPFHKYPRYHPHDLLPCDDDLESSYFRRRPASILTSGNISLDAKRYSWMPVDGEAVRLEGPRPICPTEIDDFHRGPYVVGGTSVESYSPKSYLSQSTEQIAGLYRCPAHIGLPAPPPPPVVPVDLVTPRTKHVSFARSHTLTSFDEAAAMGLRTSVRSLKSARSQERLIGGKKPIITIGALQDQHQHQQIPIIANIAPQSQQQHQQQQHQQIQQHQQHQQHQQQQTQLVSFHHHHHPQLIAHHQHFLQQPQHPTQVGHQMQPQFQALAGLPIGNASGGSILGFLVQQQPPPQHPAHQQQQHQPTRLLHQHQSSLSPEVVVVEKVKRGGMKTQATQTDQRKGINHLNLSLSPRTIHRVKMVSQGAQTNGMLNNRKLTKSLSEMAGGGRAGATSISGDNLFFMPDQHEMHIDHEQLHRTYSEEPPRSPLICPQSSQTIQGQMLTQHRFYEPPAPPIGALPQSRTSSRTSTEHLPSSSPLGRQLSGHSRNHSEDSAMSYRSSMEMPPLLYSSYGPMSVPTMASSRLSGGTQASGASTASNSLNFNQAQFFRKNMDGRGSISRLRNSPIRVNYDEKNILVSQDLPIEPFDYEANSLPRRTCGHHRGHEEFHSYSLPRREHHHPQEVVCRHVTECAELLNGSRNSIQLKRGISQESSTDSNQASLDRRRASTMGINIVPKTHVAYRRPSMPVHPFEDFVTGRGLSTETEDENTAKTTTTDNEEGDDDFGRDAEVPMIKKKNLPEDEQEIFIDFKPHISPTPSPRRRKHLQKTLSDGEILIEKNQDNFRDSVIVASASEEDIKVEDLESTKNYYYQNLPIKDEGIFDRKSIPNLLVLPHESDSITNGIRQKREAFRKRSISLEDPAAEEEPRQLKSAPPSPGDGGTVVSQSAYPSSDSLANDLTIRDHSDGIWNESQVTVLPADLKNGERSEQIATLLTPSAKRKNLILQHQQRSSIDTDALELEEQFSDQSLQNMPLPKLKPASTQTIISPSSSASSSLLTVPGHQPPQISIIPSLTIETNENENGHIKTSLTCRRSSHTLSQAVQDKRKIEPLVHAVSPQRNLPDSPEKQPIPHEQHLPVDSAPKNYTDISECSTNTDEYITCTDNSKRTTGIKTPPTTATSSSSTQVPVSAQSSQTVQEGSSFESASSLYSTRGDGLSEDNPQTDEVPSSTDIPKLTSLISQPTHIFVSNNVPPQLPKSQEIVPPTKVSPSHSVTSSSSDSYNLTDSTRKKILATHSTNTTKIPLSPLRLKNGMNCTSIKNAMISKKKCESVSDEEKSEKRYSSSGYYESPHDEEQHRLNAKQRRAKIEEDRRRRKSNMKLDIERENLRALTSPIKKPSPQAKQQLPMKSPEGYKNVALNVLGATSPSKIKRFRPKIKRQPRKSSFTDTIASGIARNPKMILKSPDLYVESTLQTQRSPSNYKNDSNLSPKKHQSCHMDTSCTKLPEKRLKAKSIESLRSVSPGSDSVFYSEADLGPEQQVHCLHCGKEVEIITAPSGSQESIPAIKDEEPDIVKPPADFADSPVIAKTSQRLYKKMDKRFRSEERHGDRSRHYRNRQENVRAKSEERGKDQSTRSPPTLRPAGSSPCVVPDDENENQTEKISLGNFQNGMYTRLTDSDVWIQLDHQTFDRHRDRRGSTDSEKAFHQKYQVILHRLVQRRCTLEMYHRQKQNIFKFIGAISLRHKLEEILELMLLIWARQGQALKIITGKNNEIDKTVVVKSDSGEFGFRIHGSKPVVVAAIEPDTPAESSGLEVGDIIISVNGIQVLDKHHTEVVKIAHAGCETLELEVARTIGVLMNEQQESPSPALYTGFLWRQSGQAKGSPNTKKWVRRWFSLRPDHCLYYYKTDSDTQPVGAIMLSNHTVEHCSVDVGRQFAFKIDSGENIAMYLAADSEETANLWVAIMSHASTQVNPWLEFSTRNLKQAPSAIHRPDCFGYLMKMGSRWSGWVKRYCVLKDACIYFYSDGNSKSAFGMACLQGYKVVAISTNAAGRKNSFEIVPPESKLKHFVFSTESEMDKKRWISALEYSIDRWIKAK